MHLDLAIDCIDYEKLDPESVVFKDGLADNPYFKIKKLEVDKSYRAESHVFNSFIIYFCVEGEAVVRGGDVTEQIKKGDNILIPAYMGEYVIEGKCTLLEITGKA